MKHETKSGLPRRVTAIRKEIIKGLHLAGFDVPTMSAAFSQPVSESRIYDVLAELKKETEGAADAICHN